MKIVWNLLWSCSPLFRSLHREVITLARSAGIYIHPNTLQNMRLTPVAMLAIITAAVKTLTRAKQAVADANAAIEPLKQKNRELQVHVDQLNAVDAQLDQALTDLREHEDPEDQPEVTEDTGPDGTGVTPPGEPPVEPVTEEVKPDSNPPAEEDPTAGLTDETGPAGVEGTPGETAAPTPKSRKR